MANYIIKLIPQSLIIFQKIFCASSLEVGKMQIILNGEDHVNKY